MTEAVRYDDDDAGPSLDTFGRSQLISRVSFEVTPKEAKTVTDFADFVAPGTEIYIPFLPKNEFVDCVPAAVALARQGLKPVPHIAARRLTSEAELASVVDELQSLLELDQVLVIAGDPREQAGPFSSSIDVLKTGILEDHGINIISVAGHPEGSPDISDDEIRDALAWKNDYAKRTGADLRIVTQFSFDAEVITGWEKRIRAEGNRLPIHVGLAAPTKLSTLMKYASMCGVKSSTRAMSKRGGSLFNLATEGAPDNIIADLQAGVEAEPASLIKGLHFYTFGASKPAMSWHRMLLAKGL